MSSLRLSAPVPKRATLAVPGDKSITHRAFLLAACARGRTEICGANAGRDVHATIVALRNLGVRIRRAGAGYSVEGAATLRDPAGTIDCANSGTTMRLLLGLVAGRVNAVLDGDASLRRRPMARVAAPLNRMGAAIATRYGKPPVRVRRVAGDLRGIHYRMPVASAQLKSALLLAALRASSPTRLVVPAVTRDHTERLLAAMGATIRAGARSIRITPSQLRSPGRLRVPGDFSSAFYLLCAAALVPGARLRISGVGINPTRTAALEVMRRMGAAVTVSRRSSWCGEPVADIAVRGGGALRNVRIAAGEVPIAIDEIPALCALAAAGRGTMRVRAASELRVKESDRIRTTVQLLRSFGSDARELPDGLIVRGGAPLRAPRSVRTRGDHRIGLAAAILAAATGSAVVIQDADCIATSFPRFAATWRQAFGGAGSIMQPRNVGTSVSSSRRVAKAMRST